MSNSCLFRPSFSPPRQVTKGRALTQFLSEYLTDNSGYPFPLSPRLPSPTDSDSDSEQSSASSVLDTTLSASSTTTSGDLWDSVSRHSSKATPSEADGGSLHSQGSSAEDPELESYSDNGAGKGVGVRRRASEEQQAKLGSTERLTTSQGARLWKGDPRLGEGQEREGERERRDRVKFAGQTPGCWILPFEVTGPCPDGDCSSSSMTRRDSDES